jgi:hypothetical protein
MIRHKMKDTYTTLVEQLGVPHRAKHAYWALIAAGRNALPAVRTGLHHASADVRHHCCRYLDHFVDSDSMGELIGMLDDADPEVRLHALHALACDRCKTDTCRPDEALVLPRALDILRNDPDTHVAGRGSSVHCRRRRA